MVLSDSLKCRWHPLANALAAAAVLLTSPLRGATPAVRSPEASILATYKVKEDAEGLRALLTSLPGGPVEGSDRIQRLIEQLGNEGFAQREMASAKLLALPAPPVKELAAALDNPDAEIRLRARKLLEQVARRPPVSALLFAALLVIRDRDVPGLAAEVLRVVPLCDSQPLRLAAEQAMGATVRRADRPLLERALANDNVQARAIVAAGMEAIEAKTDAAPSTAPVTWIEFLDANLIHGRYDGERTEFLNIPPSLADHFERTTRTASTIDAVVNRHGTSPWLYPIRGKNELPRTLAQGGKKHYPIRGCWRQHWTQWVVLDENGRSMQGGPPQAPHLTTQVEYLLVPISSRAPRP